MHENEVAHRDLKADNIIIMKDGSVKLVDFGFAKEEMISKMYANTKAGTLCYRAPEFYNVASNQD